MIDLINKIDKNTMKTDTQIYVIHFTLFPGPFRTSSPNPVFEILNSLQLDLLGLFF